MIHGVQRAFTVAAIATVMVACGSGQEATPAPVPAAPAQTPSAPAVTLVSLQDLRASVPQFTGWTRGEITAQEGPAPSRSTHVQVTFTRGAETLSLEIADTGGDERSIESLEHMAGTSTSRTVENGYFKGTTVATFPAVESWNTVDKLGELSVLIRRRYIINVAGAGLSDAQPMRTLAEAVDTSRLR
ncbi:MAG: hypothetical protein IPL75_04150 [Acidobacteria bacterium]|nr:hypothetical protein [Acidobacteriota bacterium]